MTIRPRQKRTVQTGGDDRNHLFRTNGHPTRTVVPTKPCEPSTSADPASVASWLCSVELKLRPLPKTRTWRGPQVLLQCSATPVKCALTQNGRGGSEAVAGTVRVPRQRRSATQAQVRAEKSRFFDGQPPLAVPLFRRPVQSRDEKLENSRDRTHWVYGVYLGVWCLSIG